ncbi:hypothetical protein M378DRAFT_162347 [Amanita muscaria Koide BX008]|uniref:Uncharacterized protein n=1 Tax=Amanita muscaria (strain Koide BX008) TaxID=946122 RepID=A0A0C2X8M3_AMAMK|nr:hypothetical protein M378DRAFT_162347 [Amanita muscaria Koide BX008]
MSLAIANPTARNPLPNVILSFVHLKVTLNACHSYILQCLLVMACSRHTSTVTTDIIHVDVGRQSLA